MHELAVMAQSIDEMKVNIAWITECFCSGVIVVTNKEPHPQPLSKREGELIDFVGMESRGGDWLING